MAASSVGRQPRRWSADGSGGGLKGRNPRSIAPGLQCTLTSVGLCCYFYCGFCCESGPLCRRFTSCWVKRLLVMELSD